MAKVERSILINAPWEVVDAVTTDGHRISDWYVGMEKSVPDANYPQVGSQIKYDYKAAGIGFDVTGTVEEFERGDHLTVRMDGMIKGVQRWSYARGRDTTTLTAVFDYEVPGGGLGKVLDKLVIERTNTANLEKSLENLKAMIESGE